MKTLPSGLSDADRNVHVAKSVYMQSREYIAQTMLLEHLLSRAKYAEQLHAAELGDRDEGEDGMSDTERVSA